MRGGRVNVGQEPEISVVCTGTGATSACETARRIERAVLLFRDIMTAVLRMDSELPTPL